MGLLSQHFNFIYPWRSYQERFLTGFDLHNQDKHLHVVAPPGSGKTVLGLEMLKRLDEKAVVLAPTLTIRNQWYERMCECFVEDDTSVSTSFDIKNLAQITFTTYQSLHSFFKNDLESNEENLIKFFVKASIKTLVLDEAHHLKNAWWKPLFILKNIPNATIVALTATPPYDSDQAEIKKYFDLCGPIDMEIGIPELVKEGNLCPHQDYVYFSKPDEAQIRYILKYREQLVAFVNYIKTNKDFINFILKHRFYSQTATHLEEIYKNPKSFSAMLIFLNATGISIDKSKTKVLGFNEKKIKFPSLSYEWVEALLTPFLLEDRVSYLDDENLLFSLDKQLRKIGGLENGKINLIGEKSLYKTLSQSATKLSSIAEIVKIESKQLKSNLRLVVLSDYIRKEYLEFQDSDSLSEINKLGVVPIFQFIRSQINNNNDYPLDKTKLAVLTGSLIIIHNSLVTPLSEIILKENFKIENLGETEFVIIKPNTKANKNIVSAMTHLFEDGHIEVLIGTKSLLGEGWDAPAINTLILASFVGSFVMSNQMRGRAIRVNPLQKEKVANIWHIACLDPTSETGGADLDLLARRFEAFCGVSLNNQEYIESGFDRLKIFGNQKNISGLNAEMTQLSSQREIVTQRWNTAIKSGNILVRELKLQYEVPSAYKKIKKLRYKDAVKMAFLELSILLVITLPELIFNNFMTIFSKGVTYFIYSILFGFMMILMPKTIKVIILYLKLGRRDKALYRTANILLKAMIETGYIIDDNQNINVLVAKFNDGAISCCLENASAKEGIQFVNYLQEIIDPIDNPRYIITQSNRLRRLLGFVSYYAVPAIFGERKEEALLFFKHWKQQRGTATLLFARNLEGRKTILKARFLSYQEDEHQLSSKKALIWK